MVVERIFIEYQTVSLGIFGFDYDVHISLFMLELIGSV